MSGVSVTVDVSVGELIDKITILEIKAARLDDPAQRENVGNELEILVAARDNALPPSAELTELSLSLKRINERLWGIEDDIRDQERAKDFGARFIELARSVYVCNDERATLKRRINELLGSRIVEEKSYAPY
ncbi:MAG: DUF6165 family protein [Rhodospirillales bacterium]|jgi:hypothetical protein|nr:DUF6165 family protein [Rhodospirillales bacterium]MDP6882755.1 DUF6165 family protein [Rhodospirillales bacterium]